MLIGSSNVTAEGCVISTLIHHPEFAFFSENLQPEHFTVVYNGMIYDALVCLARSGMTHVDSINIINVLNRHDFQKKYSIKVEQKEIDATIEISDEIARGTVEEYKSAVEGVVECAFRRTLRRKLMNCVSLCDTMSQTDLESRVYKEIDGTMLEFCANDEIPEYKDVIDQCWADIEKRQHNGASGIPFPFPALNDYVQIEPGELVVFGAEQKTGKSIFLLNCAADLLKSDKAVLYIDSELNTRMFTCRLLAHLTKIKFKQLKAGEYGEEQADLIKRAINWLKTRKFVHIYMPTFEAKNIYMAAKKVKHTMGLDVIIVDYFKSKGEGDAFASYQELGKLVDTVKNEICGSMDIAGIAAAQATVNGRLADSSKIARNASTICLLSDKTPEEIETDGVECGNKKLRVVFNRNGEQMYPDEYIDLQFNGNLISYKQAKQHKREEPY